ncbi:DUF4301 family protein [Dysgonomonas alginatilytica]|uniref:DUF4301 family protein n=1 Tax=Dysgonomonas alginatilytica TaxID=1605892 RepID=UPI003742548C
MFTDRDLEQFKVMGVDVASVDDQINRFKTGFPYLEIANFATNGKGISVVEASDYDKYITAWDEYCKSGHSIIKFVPASGAASRMFKDLFEFIQGRSDLSDNDFVRFFFDNIQKFAFFEDLNAACVTKKGLDVKSLIHNKQYKDILEIFLLKDGLNYGGLPKGLLKFHSYENRNRTPVEEHLVEGSQYAKSADGEVVLHFTVSPEHRSLFQDLINVVLVDYEKALNVKFNVSFSEQKKKTDTIAVDKDNLPFRDGQNLLFRPGGHGALIENLNDLSSDVIFIKNIDNVVPDKFKQEETFYKKLLAGYLVDIQTRVFRYLELIDSGVYSREELLEILYFLQDELNVKNPDTKYLEDAELVLYLQRKLNRPIRVCGMVKNVGEAGGGPFFAVNADGTVSLQILESSQIDLSDPVKKDLFTSGTHFNPVDIVCAVKDYKGEKFNLIDYIDINTGFISEKTKEGRALKALELPGLWNGAMSDWNTVFVEVPLGTFNPVKSVNDLLRKEHLSNA